MNVLCGLFLSVLLAVSTFAERETENGFLRAVDVQDDFKSGFARRAGVAMHGPVKRSYCGCSCTSINGVCSFKYIG